MIKTFSASWQNLLAGLSELYARCSEKLFEGKIFQEIFLTKMVVAFVRNICGTLGQKKFGMVFKIAIYVSKGTF